MTMVRSRIVRWGFLAVAVGLCLYTVARQWQQVRGALAELGVPVILGSFACVALAMLASAEVWRVLLGASGSPLPRKAAASIMFVGQLGKYLPGSVWPVLAQMELGRAHKVPRRHSATAAMLTMLVSLCGGLLVAVATLPFTTPSSGYRWFLLAVPVLLAMLHPRLLNAVLRVGTRGRISVDGLDLRRIRTALAWSVLSWLCYGAPIWLLATRLGAPSGQTVLLAIGGFAFAWSVGFLVVITPAGAGVRDVLLVATLAAVLPVGDATAVALVSRLLMTVGDVFAAGIAASLARVRKRHLRSPVSH